jgi:hypothetical protein
MQWAVVAGSITGGISPFLSPSPFRPLEFAIGAFAVSAVRREHTHRTSGGDHSGTGPMARFTRLSPAPTRTMSGRDSPIHRRRRISRSFTNPSDPHRQTTPHGTRRRAESPPPTRGAKHFDDSLAFSTAKYADVDRPINWQ